MPFEYNFLITHNRNCTINLSGGKVLDERKRRVPARLQEFGCRKCLLSNTKLSSRSRMSIDSGLLHWCHRLGRFCHAIPILTKWNNDSILTKSMESFKVWKKSFGSLALWCSNYIQVLFDIISPSSVAVLSPHDPTCSVPLQPFWHFIRMMDDSQSANCYENNANSRFIPKWKWLFLNWKSNLFSTLGKWTKIKYYWKKSFLSFIQILRIQLIRGLEEPGRLRMVSNPKIHS